MPQFADDPSLAIQPAASVPTMVQDAAPAVPTSGPSFSDDPNAWMNKVMLFNQKPTPAPKEDLSPLPAQMYYTLPEVDAKGNLKPGKETSTSLSDIPTSEKMSDYHKDLRQQWFDAHKDQMNPDAREMFKKTDLNMYWNINRDNEDQNLLSWVKNSDNPIAKNVYSQYKQDVPDGSTSLSEYFGNGPHTVLSRIDQGVTDQENAIRQSHSAALKDKLYQQYLSQGVSPQEADAAATSEATSEANRHYTASPVAMAKAEDVWSAPQRWLMSKAPEYIGRRMSDVQGETTEDPSLIGNIIRDPMTLPTFASVGVGALGKGAGLVSALTGEDVGAGLAKYAGFGPEASPITKILQKRLELLPEAPRTLQSLSQVTNTPTSRALGGLGEGATLGTLSSGGNQLSNLGGDNSGYHGTSTGGAFAQGLLTGGVGAGLGVGLGATKDALKRQIVLSDLKKTFGTKDPYILFPHNYEDMTKSIPVGTTPDNTLASYKALIEGEGRKYGAGDVGYHLSTEGHDFPLNAYPGTTPSNKSMVPPTVDELKVSNPEKLADLYKQSVANTGYLNPVERKADLNRMLNAEWEATPSFVKSPILYGPKGNEYSPTEALYNARKNPGLLNENKYILENNWSWPKNQSTYDGGTRTMRNSQAAPLQYERLNQNINTNPNITRSTEQAAQDNKAIADLATKIEASSGKYGNTNYGIFGDTHDDILSKWSQDNLPTAARLNNQQSHEMTDGTLFNPSTDLNTYLEFYSDPLSSLNGGSKAGMSIADLLHGPTAVATPGFFSRAATTIRNTAGRGGRNTYNALTDQPDRLLANYFNERNSTEDK